MKRNETRNEKEFIKDDKSLREDASKLQQKGGANDPRFEREILKNISKDKKKEVEKDETVLDEQNKNRFVKENPKSDYMDLRTKRIADLRAGVAHDMRDQALGQIYKIQGANVDYDEIDKMTRNNIRDVGELVDESLQNDGFDEKVSEVERVMTGYVYEGKPDINAISQLNRDYDMNVVANAFVDVVKEASVRDVKWLEKISDACQFEHPSYERVFDSIRAKDAVADKALDVLESEIGMER